MTRCYRGLSHCAPLALTPDCSRSSLHLPLAVLRSPPLNLSPCPCGQDAEPAPFPHPPAPSRSPLSSSITSSSPPPLLCPSPWLPSPAAAGGRSAPPGHWWLLPASPRAARSSERARGRSARPLPGAGRAGACGVRASGSQRSGGPGSAVSPQPAARGPQPGVENLGRGGGRARGASRGRGPRGPLRSSRRRDP